ncbi:MAG: hypothetical protein K6E12_04750 [Saccharofermentans sp.]|nr:hypothetical protein [Saccharofermentans sp.]
MRKNAIKNIKLYLVCLLVAVLFAALYSTTTTPLLPEHWGYDSAFFILVGQGMTKGLMPYRDFFDMKGPYLFLLEYIGQLICYGRTGAFIVQCINLSICFYITCKTSDLFSKRRIWLHRLVAVIAVLLVPVYSYEGGNLTEEYCLPWILGSLYFCLKYLKESEEKKSYKHSIWVSLFNGAAVGVICFIRITNAATIGAVLLTVFIVMLKKKEIKNALINLAMVFAGFAATCAVPCIFFAAKNMLGEMLEQVFLFGFAYSSEVGFAEKFVNVITAFNFFLLLLLLPVTACFIYREKWYMKLLSIASAFLLLVAITMGNAYYHYLTLFIPHVALAVFIAYKNGGKVLKVKKNIVCIVCFTILLAFNSVRIVTGASKAVFTVYSFVIAQPYGGALDGVTAKLQSIPSVAKHIYTGDENSDVLDIASHIPDEDKDSVYCFGDVLWSRWYGVTDTIPAYKYMDWQSHYIELIPGLEQEITSWIADEGSTYIVTVTGEEPVSDDINKAILENYSEEFANGSYTLYRRNS